MAFFPSKKVVITPATLLLVFLISSSSSARLSHKFYANSCPKLLEIVKSEVQSAIETERRMGASLLRLHFHDCFVNGCDGSILLDDTPSFTGEKTAVPNHSIRGFEVVDNIKAAVETKCPGVVSCADILAIAARDSVVLLGGPHWDVKLGRRDAKTASLSTANTGIPLTNWTLHDTISTFNALGLSTTDFVALSGAHTLRRAHRFGASLDQTPIKFNNYFSKFDVTKCQCHQKFLEVEQTKSIVTTYSDNVTTFYRDFANAMIKMGDILPSAEFDGEIRKNCRRAN